MKPRFAIRYRYLRFLVFALGLGPGAGRLLSQTVAPAATTAAAPVILQSPLDYQVFQRRNRLEGKIEIGGDVRVAADRVEARLTGTSLSGPLPGTWISLRFNKPSGRFKAAPVVPAGGFYRLEIRVLRAGQTVARLSVPHFGVGEVFVIAGQSNATNYGEVPQTTATGMVTAFDGSIWQIANDPQPGVQDHSRKGSFIPAFGDALYAKIHVPIGVACVGHGSTSVRQWLPARRKVPVMPTMTKFITKDAHGDLVSDGTLFNGMMTRIHQLEKNGFRAILWHQGESDANQAPAHQIDASTYRKMIVQLIRATRKDAGWKMPWLVAEATYHNPSDPDSPSLEEAQRSLWQSGIAMEGPDTDTLGAAYRQNHGAGVHFSDAGLKAHGSLWANAVERYLDTVMR